MPTDTALLERLRDAVPTGGAVCLIGSGFSTGGTDQNGARVPSSQELIVEIKSAVGIDPSEDANLTDIADYCEGKPTRKNELQKILVNRLTLCNPNAAQALVVEQPWRSIFTTNFDDTIERCLRDGTYQPITPISDPTARTSGKLPIYYMHGRAKDLLESSKEPKIVISERNYLNLQSEQKELYAQLKNELFSANLIVIIGYSMRDLDIARILLESGYAFRRKTIIICDPSEKNLAISRLSKFGDVLPIGVEGFAAELAEAAVVPSLQRASLQFVDDVQAAEASEAIESDDFVKLILTGNFSSSKYLAQIQQATGAGTPYCIRRRQALDVIMGRAAGGVSRFVVSSDFGNGKSIFLDQLSTELSTSGYRVLRISSRVEEVFAELDVVLGAREQAAFLIDDVIRYRNVAQFICTRLNSFGILVCSVRGDPGEVAIKELVGGLGGAVRQIDLNHLSAEELHDWDVALERWGLWEERISLSSIERLAFLSNACASENRSIVLALFRSSQIATKIDQIVEFFLRRGRHQRAFAALLISSLCQQHVSWESLVSWLDIDEQRLREDIQQNDLSSLFFNGREWNVFTSAQLAEHILRTKFVAADKDTILDVFSSIVLGTAESATDSHLGAIFRENLKELMKFRFLTRLFGDDDAAVLLIGRVYKRLAEARLIRNNPQFWLQYAMSRMEVDDLSGAETYLNTALGLAKGRGMEYSPFQILDQRARLYFRKNSLHEGSFKLSEIKSAIKDLTELLDHKDREVIYLFRSVPLIQDFVELQIDACDQTLRAEILVLLEKIKTAGAGYSKLPRSQKGETKILQKALEEILRTLRFA